MSRQFTNLTNMTEKLNNRDHQLREVQKNIGFAENSLDEREHELAQREA